jgi:hypothetical protein
VSVDNRRPKRNSSVPCSVPKGGRDGGVDTQRLSDDTVEILQRVQFIHCGRLGLEREQLVPQFGLNVRVYSERVERPRRCVTATQHMVGELCREGDKSHTLLSHVPLPRK